VFAWFVFYVPNYLLAPRTTTSRPIRRVTPTHIVPEWYYLPFYAILRANPEQAARRHCAVRLDRHPGVPAVARHLAGCASANYRPLFRQFLLDLHRGHGRSRLAWRQARRGRLCHRGRVIPDVLLLPSRTFFIILPVLGWVEKTKPLPNSISEAILKEGLPVGASGPAPTTNQELEADRWPAPFLALVLRPASLCAAVTHGIATGYRAGTRKPRRPPRLKWSFAGPFRPLRQGPAAARPQGLQGGLRGSAMA